MERAYAALLALTAHSLAKRMHQQFHQQAQPLQEHQQLHLHPPPAHQLAAVAQDLALLASALCLDPPLHLTFLAVGAPVVEVQTLTTAM